MNKTNLSENDMGKLRDMTTEIISELETEEAQQTEIMEQFKNSKDRFTVLGISTSHFSKPDIDLLVNNTNHPELMIYDTGYGVFIKFIHGEELFEVGCMKTLTPNTVELLKLIRLSGYDAVEIDCDATVYENLETHEH